MLIQCKQWVICRTHKKTELLWCWPPRVRRTQQQTVSPVRQPGLLTSSCAADCCSPVGKKLSGLCCDGFWFYSSNCLKLFKINKQKKKHILLSFKEIINDAKQPQYWNNTWHAEYIQYMPWQYCPQLAEKPLWVGEAVNVDRSTIKSNQYTIPPPNIS